MSDRLRLWHFKKATVQIPYPRLPDGGRGVILLGSHFLLEPLQDILPVTYLYDTGYLPLEPGNHPESADFRSIATFFLSYGFRVPIRDRPFRALLVAHEGRGSKTSSRLATPVIWELALGSQDSSLPTHENVFLVMSLIAHHEMMMVFHGPLNHPLTSRLL